MKLCSPPSGTFPGKNFMTPNVIAYFKLREGYAELSRGTGLYDQPIFGVTVRPEVNVGDRSKLFQDETAARRYIESMS